MSRKSKLEIDVIKEIAVDDARNKTILVCNRPNEEVHLIIPTAEIAKALPALSNSLVPPFGISEVVEIDLKPAEYKGAVLFLTDLNGVRIPYYLSLETLNALSAHLERRIQSISGSSGAH